MSRSCAIYRVVTDAFSGFEVQYRTPWWPFWRQCGRGGGSGTNTNPTLEAAEEFARKHARRNEGVVKVLGAIKVPEPQDTPRAAE
jgi:hypothetical protein